MRAYKIKINLLTEDPDGNCIENKETRIINTNPTITDFCELFFNAIEKQEYKKSQIMLEMKDFFLKFPFTEKT